MKKISLILIINLVVFSFLSVGGSSINNWKIQDSNTYEHQTYLDSNWVNWINENDYSTPEFVMNNINQRTSQSDDTWTLMFYLAGDNNLEGSMIDILNELEVVGSNENVKLIAQLDRIPSFDHSNYDWTEMLRYFVKRDINGYNHEIISEPVEYLGEQNLGDPNVLFDFINWSINMYPADNYCLFLADHGHAWDGCCYDWTSDGDHLTMFELKSVINSFNNLTGKKLDLLCFNACAMGSVEVYYQLKDLVNISIGSEDFQYGPLSYMYFLSDLVNNTDWSAEQFAKKIVYHTAYSGKCFVKDLFAIDLNKIDDIAEKTSVFANNLNVIASEDANVISDVIYNSVLIEHRYRTELADLWDLANTTQKIILGQNLKESAQEVKDAIDSSVIESYSINLDLNRPGHGMSINLLDESSILEDIFYDSYQNLDFSQNSLWDEYLLTYYNADKINSPPSMPVVSGKTKGKIFEEYEYCGQSIDPERQYVHLKFSFDDGTETEWLNREVFCQKHKWMKSGTYIVKVKAIDEPFFDQDITCGNESDWGTLTVSMPRLKYSNFNFLDIFSKNQIIKRFLSFLL